MPETSPTTRTLPQIEASVMVKRALVQESLLTAIFKEELAPAEIASLAQAFAHITSARRG